MTTNVLEKPRLGKQRKILRRKLIQQRKHYWETPMRQYLLLHSPVLTEKALSEERSAKSTISLREIEKAWVESHIKELSAFAGEWLVVEGGELVAHNVDFVEAVREARSCGVQVPYVTKLPLEKVSPFIG